MTIHKSIGDFGVEHVLPELSFTFFGTKIRVHPEAGELSYVAFMEKAMQADEEDESEGIALMMGYLRDQVHPDDFDEFFSIAKKKRQQVQDLMAISKAILEETSSFPTGQPSDSPTGRPAIARKSKAISSSRVKRPRKSKSEAALELLQGRPDLQMAVVRAQEKQAG